MGDNNKKKEEQIFIPGVVLDEGGEEIYYELTGSKCSRCPLKGLCG